MLVNPKTGCFLPNPPKFVLPATPIFGNYRVGCLEDVQNNVGQPEVLKTSINYLLTS